MQGLAAGTGETAPVAVTEGGSVSHTAAGSWGLSWDGYALDRTAADSSRTRRVIKPPQREPQKMIPFLVQSPRRHRLQGPNTAVCTPTALPPWLFPVSSAASRNKSFAVNTVRPKEEGQVGGSWLKISGRHTEGIHAHAGLWPTGQSLTCRLPSQLKPSPPPQPEHSLSTHSMDASYL